MAKRIDPPSSQTANPIADRHPELRHYTTQEGLEGILRSQQLWATRFDHLNDSEEYEGFFLRRAPELIQEAAETATDQLLRAPSGRHEVRLLGGRTPFVKRYTRDLSKVLRRHTIDFAAPFITSFCGFSANSQPHRDGLLSQWRGYGGDGGYALCLDTKDLCSLMAIEGRRFQYQFLSMADVDYYDAESAATPLHDETKHAEQILKDSIVRFIVSRHKTSFDDLYDAIYQLCCLSKHHGFREETEVRIVAIPMNDEVFEKGTSLGRTDPRKDISTRRDPSGREIRYIKLFGAGNTVELPKLPIRRVIVGPHPEKEARRIRIAERLTELGIDADVTISGIPYLGR